MQAQTAARFDDILVAHVTFMGAGDKDSRLSGSLVGPDKSMGSGGLATPETCGRPRAPPQQTERC